MKQVSTNKEADPVSFSTAALQGLAPDGGLYVPKDWPRLSERFLANLGNESLQDIGFEVSRLFVDELDNGVLKKVVDDALNFDAPLVKLTETEKVLELFHGPTLAFKDFGARFMSRLFSALRNETDQDLIILAATSGDTGSAVAQGFLDVEGIKVCLLYPSSKVSHIQEQQLTTAGQNVTALEIDGTFDDCQKMVKQAFSDNGLNEQLLLSSANSINIARLLPQIFYYLHAVAQLDSDYPPIFCVPSGNFGNLTAGLMAQKIGMPVSVFIAATNVNDVFPTYLRTGEFKSRTSEQTISNAMDVGNPSNFERILYLFNGSREQIKQHIWAASFSDSETKKSIKKVYQTKNYLMDPHTAVGYCAVKQYKRQSAGYFGEDQSAPFIILSTAHPAKFGDVIEPVVDQEISVPDRLAQCLKKEKQSIFLNADYQNLKEWLLEEYG